MTLRRSSPLLICLFAGVVLAAAGGVGLWTSNARPPHAGRTLIIGADDAPPLYHITPGQPVQGLAVDVMNRAAADLGYRLEWRTLEGRKEDFIKSGKVDIWPVLSITEERKKLFHMTRPWLRNTLSILTLATGPIRQAADTGHRSVGIWPNGVTDTLAARYLSSARIVPFRSRTVLVQAVCAGEVEAGFLEDRMIEDYLLKRPRGCADKPLAIRPVEGAETLMAVASTRAAANIADALADRIADLAGTGELDSIVSQWSVFRTNESRSVVALRELQRRNRAVSAALGIIGLAAFAMFLQVRNSRRTAGILRREVMDRHKAQEATRYAFEQMEHQAHHDSLTGLPNRLLFERMLKDSLSIASESGTQVALLYLDLDRFKQINDSLGHAAGDELLRQAAERLGSVKPEHSFIARLGGDEFAMLLLHVATRQQGEDAARRIIGILSTPFQLEGAPWHCPASIGVSLYPDDAVNAAALQRNADTAMYHAKRTAPGKFVSFARYMGEQADRSLLIEQALRAALENNAFRIHYQAQFARRGSALTGFEALLRLTDAKLGTILPGEFIPVAEDTGLIVPIGEWVLREACQQAVRWQQEGLQRVSLAVNVSPTQLVDGDFARTLRTVLQETGMPPELLEIELTETGILADSGDAVRAIKRCGVRISVDDFGTGYSSLSCLHNVPADCVKIDRSFIRDSASIPGSLPFIRTIVTLARSLGMDTVAEGVESQSQLDAVISAGCDRFQGYLLAHPLPAERAEAQLTQLSREECAA